eukprot:m.87526 g.87526  ORF g.87526 m.87526 type:complete len:231 (+) comp13114_c0_seq1:172-864(+)
MLYYLSSQPKCSFDDLRYHSTFMSFNIQIMFLMLMTIYICIYIMFIAWQLADFTEDCVYKCDPEPAIYKRPEQFFSKPIGPFIAMVQVHRVGLFIGKNGANFGKLKQIGDEFHVRVSISENLLILKSPFHNNIEDYCKAITSGSRELPFKLTAEEKSDLQRIKTMPGNKVDLKPEHVATVTVQVKSCHRRELQRIGDEFYVTVSIIEEHKLLILQSYFPENIEVYCKALA